MLDWEELSWPLSIAFNKCDKSISTMLAWESLPKDGNFGRETSHIALNARLMVINAIFIDLIFDLLFRAILTMLMWAAYHPPYMLGFQYWSSSG